MSVSLADVREARDRFDETIVRRTPIESSRTLSEEVGGTVALKMEQLQRTGSFKVRGASNKLAAVSAGGRDVTEVVAASAGNHAQGVALAAANAGIDATVVMPRNAPQSKVDATRGYGATVELEGDDFQAAMSHAKGLVSEDRVFVEAYDDPAVVAGQGTLGLEILDQVPDADTVVVPVGGGGLIAGIATVVDELSPGTRVVGVQAEGAETVARSLRKGAPQSNPDVRTIADGIATGGISQLTFDLIDDHVDDVLTVPDTAIAESLLFLLERTKQLVEGAGVAPVAAIRSDALDVSGETVVPVLSGGNLDLTDLGAVLTRGLQSRGKLVRLRVRIVDEPGEMGRLSHIIGDHDANIQRARHVRTGPDLEVGEAYLEFRVTTSGRDHSRQIVDAIRDAGYEVERTSDRN
jgi:threonine dehydratase